MIWYPILPPKHDRELWEQIQRLVNAELPHSILYFYHDPAPPFNDIIGVEVMMGDRVYRSETTIKRALDMLSTFSIGHYFAFHINRMIDRDIRRL